MAAAVGSEVKVTFSRGVNAVAPLGSAFKVEDVSATIGKAEPLMVV